MAARRRPLSGRLAFTTKCLRNWQEDENIAQAFQFVESGSAEIGIVALSLALAPTAREQGRYWEVPAKLYAKLEQSGVILAHATNPQDARVFRSFLMTVAARRTLVSYGFF